jgi:hypothetical protein
MAVKFIEVGLKIGLPVINVLKKHELGNVRLMEMFGGDELQQISWGQEVITLPSGVQVLEQHSINVCVGVASHHEKEVHLTVPSLRNQASQEG